MNLNKHLIKYVYIIQIPLKNAMVLRNVIMMENMMYVCLLIIPSLVVNFHLCIYLGLLDCFYIDARIITDITLMLIKL